MPGWTKLIDHLGGCSSFLLDNDPDARERFRVSQTAALSDLGFSVEELDMAPVGRFAVEDDLAAGRLVPLLEAYSPQDRELLHALFFVGGSPMPARVGVFVDVLAERLGAPGTG